MANLSASKRSRLTHLDVYKGICILFIIFTHFDWSEQERLRLLFPFWIEMAVPIFMVISGYVYSMSYERSTLSLSSLYSFRELSCKLIRFLIPYGIIFVIELVLKGAILKEQVTIGFLIKAFLRGGSGPGTYYTPTMIQTIFLSPLVYWVIKKFEVKGLFGFFAINILYELFKSLISMGPAAYRLIALRYLFVFSFGVFLFHRKNKQLTVLDYAVGAIGAIYIIMTQYLGFQPFITNMWVSTSVIACFYVVPIMCFAIRKENVHNRFLELLGMASYNIFFVQMLYYWALFGKVKRAINQNSITLLLSFAICIVLGIAFYKLESPLTKKIVKKLKRKK